MSNLSIAPLANGLAEVVNPVVIQLLQRRPAVEKLFVN
jgi:hypothetical protein